MIPLPACPPGYNIYKMSDVNALNVTLADERKERALLFDVLSRTLKESDSQKERIKELNRDIAERESRIEALELQIAALQRENSELATETTRLIAETSAAQDVLIAGEVCNELDRLMRKAVPRVGAPLGTEDRRTLGRLLDDFRLRAGQLSQAEQVQLEQLCAFRDRMGISDDVVNLYRAIKNARHGVCHYGPFVASASRAKVIECVRGAVDGRQELGVFAEALVEALGKNKDRPLDRDDDGDDDE